LSADSFFNELINLGLTLSYFLVFFVFLFGFLLVFPDLKS